MNDTPQTPPAATPPPATTEQATPAGADTTAGGDNQPNFKQGDIENVMYPDTAAGGDATAAGGDSTVPGGQDTTQGGDSTVEGGDKKTDDTTEGGDKNETTEGGDAVEYSEFTMPEGFTAPAELMEGFKGKAAEMGLKQEQAQEFIDMFVDAQKQQFDAVEAQKQSWQKAVIDHPEIGGENLDKNIAAAKSVVDKFGNEQTKEVLETYGFGNHIGLVGMLVNIAKEFKADSIGGETTGNDSAPKQKTHSEIFYPDMPQEQIGGNPV